MPLRRKKGYGGIGFRALRPAYRDTSDDCRWLPEWAKTAIAKAAPAYAAATVLPSRATALRWSRETWVHVRHHQDASKAHYGGKDPIGRISRAFHQEFWRLALLSLIEEKHQEEE